MSGQLPAYIEEFVDRTLPDEAAAIKAMSPADAAKAIKAAMERDPAVCSELLGLVAEWGFDVREASASPRTQATSLHPGMDEKSIRLVHWGEFYESVGADGAFENERYYSEVLAEPEHCACDGNPMPANHPVFRDAKLGCAISAEHCEVIAEVIAVDVDEMGHAFVEAVEHSVVGRWIAGIWYERDGQMIDNREGGSEPWTRDVAARALRPEVEPSEAVRPQEDDLVVSPHRAGDVGKVFFVDDEGIEVQWNEEIESHTWDEVAELQLVVVDQCRECGEVRADFTCVHCGAKVCWFCAEDHSVSVHSTSEQQAAYRRWTSWPRRLIRLGLDNWPEIPVALFVFATLGWGPRPWNGVALLAVLACIGPRVFGWVVSAERWVARQIRTWARRRTSTEVA